MSNAKLPNVKLTVLTTALLAATGFIAKPAYSQSIDPPTGSAQQIAQTPAQATDIPTNIQASQHRAAAVQLYQALELDFDFLHRIAAEGATTPAIAEFEAEVGRALTESESQQMLNFWYGQFQEILSPQSIENAIVTVYMENFTLEELDKINQSADPIAQVSSPTVSAEVEAAIVAIADPYLTDETWVNNTAIEMIEALPFLQEQYGQPPLAI